MSNFLNRLLKRLFLLHLKPRRSKRLLLPPRRLPLHPLLPRNLLRKPLQNRLLLLRPRLRKLPKATGTNRYIAEYRK